MKSAIGCRRFENIKSKLKLSKPGDEDCNDKAWRVRQVMNLFRRNIKLFGYFQTAIPVDEMVAKYYARTSMKQFILGKQELG